MKELSRDLSTLTGSLIIDRRGTILGFDEGFEELTGWQAMEVVGRNKSTPGAANEARRGETPPLFEGELPAIERPTALDLTVNRRDGRRLEVEARARLLPGPGERILISVQRVLSRSAQSASRIGTVPRDGLTALPDREAFKTQIVEDMRAATENARPLALILADVDHLRAINDRLGHEAGDEVLRQLAGMLRVSVEDEHRIFRLGDDDFAVLLPNAGRGEARQVAAGVRSTVERFRQFPKDPSGKEVPVTLSLGAASVPTDAETGRDLIERATDALNEARAMGRNRVWCYLRRPRVPVQVPVYFDGAEPLLVGYSRDLSPSGIFVQTSVPIEIGMRCAFNFPLPGLDGRVHVIGRIVRTVEPETCAEAREVRIPGMGVEFERFGGTDDRRAIDSFLHGRESTSLRPETGILSI